MELNLNLLICSAMCVTVIVIILVKHILDDDKGN